MTKLVVPQLLMPWQKPTAAEKDLRRILSLFYGLVHQNES